MDMDQLNSSVSIAPFGLQLTSCLVIRDDAWLLAPVLAKSGFELDGWMSLIRCADDFGYGQMTRVMGLPGSASKGQLPRRIKAGKD
jgi:hypothetical protein